MLHTDRLWNLLARTRLYWLGPILVLVPLAFLAALFKPTVWQAHQAFTVRDEAIGEGAFAKAGRFVSTEQLQSAQETILQFVHSRQVLEQALQHVGPSRPARAANWPTPQSIEDLRDSITLGAPKGAELGKTEMLFLTAKADSPQRAAALVDAIGQSLQTQLQSFRAQQAHGIVTELDHEVQLIDERLRQARQSLSQLEASLGADLGEMRTLSAGQAGESNLRTTLSQIETEIRQADAAGTVLEKQSELFSNALADPRVLLAAPTTLLENHPSLRNLQAGLADARIKAASALAQMTPKHPQARVAQQTVTRVEQELAHEIRQAMQTAETELSVNHSLIDRLQQQRDQVRTKLNRLAEHRAEYEQLTSQVTHFTTELHRAQTALADAQASEQAARQSSLITAVAPAEAALRPLGPGRLTLLLAGLMATAVTSVGLIVLVTPVEELVKLWRPIEFATPNHAPPEVQQPAETSGPTAPAAPAARPTTVSSVDWAPWPSHAGWNSTLVAACYANNGETVH